MIFFSLVVTRHMSRTMKAFKIKPSYVRLPPTYATIAFSWLLSRNQAPTLNDEKAVLMNKPAKIRTRRGTFAGGQLFAVDDKIVETGMDYLPKVRTNIVDTSDSIVPISGENMFSKFSKSNRIQTTGIAIAAVESATNVVSKIISVENAGIGGIADINQHVCIGNDENVVSARVGPGSQHGIGHLDSATSNEDKDKNVADASAVHFKNGPKSIVDISHNSTQIPNNANSESTANDAIASVCELQMDIGTANMSPQTCNNDVSKDIMEVIGGDSSDYIREFGRNYAQTTRIGNMTVASAKIADPNDDTMEIDGIIGTATNQKFGISNAGNAMAAPIGIDGGYGNNAHASQDDAGNFTMMTANELKNQNEANTSAALSKWNDKNNDFFREESTTDAKSIKGNAETAEANMAHTEATPYNAIESVCNQQVDIGIGRIGNMAPLVRNSGVTQYMAPVIGADAGIGNIAIASAKVTDLNNAVDVAIAMDEADAAAKENAKDSSEMEEAKNEMKKQMLFYSQFNPFKRHSNLPFALVGRKRAKSIDSLLPMTTIIEE